jgi:aconitate hydratase
MEPRFLGVKAVLVKSFARIHETNQKQGLLGLIFDNESDYDKIQENDTINFTDLVDFARENH